jgi:tetratricopeptide (TPR) repeat protein
MTRSNVFTASRSALCGLALLFLLACPFWTGARADNKAEAEKLYSRAMAMMHESLDNKTLNQAVALLEKAAELDPKNEEIWIQLAWRYWLLGDEMPMDSKEEKKQRQELFEKGQAAGEKAMALNKRSVGGLYWYNVNMAAAGEMKGILESLSLAGQLFSNISRVDRRDPYYLYGATRRFGSEIFVRVPAWLTERFGFKPEYVEEDLLMNIEKWPNYFDNYTYLARVYVWSGQKDKALEMLEFVLENDPSIMPEEKAENERQQKFAREMWKEYTGKEWPEK